MSIERTLACKDGTDLDRLAELMLNELCLRPFLGEGKASVRSVDLARVGKNFEGHFFSSESISTAAAANNESSCFCRKSRS